MVPTIPLPAGASFICWFNWANSTSVKLLIRAFASAALTPNSTSFFVLQRYQSSLGCFVY